MAEDREHQQLLGFLQAVATATGATPREIGYITISNIRILGLKLGDQSLSEPDRIDHLHAFLFLQCAEMPVITKAIRGYSRAIRGTFDVPAAMTVQEAFDNFIDTFVTPWLASMDPAKLEEGFAQLDLFSETAAAMVDPGEPPAESAPNRPVVTDPN